MGRQEHVGAVESTRASHPLAAARPEPLRLSRTRQRRLARHLERFPAVRLLVLGDVMLDHYVWGTVSRISPEAPVPVVAVRSETLQLGGAANVAQNILALGGQVDLIGVVGRDDNGQRLLAELRGKGLTTAGVLVDPQRPTITKTRVVAHSQQIVRYDREERRPVDGELRRSLLRYIHSRIADVQAIVVSDYAKGMVSRELMRALIRIARRRRVRVIVDPKVGHFPFYRGANVITPNTAEALQGAGVHEVAGADRMAAVLTAGPRLCRRLGCEAVLITRGEHGMSLFQPPARVRHIPTVAREVYDVTGAGDTVIGTLALALGAGATLEEAALLANYAAGIVVGRIGTATVTADQIRRELGL